MNAEPGAGVRATASGPSQTDVVIRGIKAMILDGTLERGSRLPVEKDLAALLDVSRGSLREGVRALATLGVLDTRQGDGTYVTSLDPAALLAPVGFLAELHTGADAAHLLAVRRVLEAESVTRAATRLTDEELAELDRLLTRIEGRVDHAESESDLEEFIEADSEFHRTIARASGNPALAALIESIVGRTQRARMWRAISESGAIERTQAEHRAILAELVRRDPELARIRMEVHLLGVERFAIDHPTAAPDPAFDQ